MPNHCTNKLNVTGPAADLAAFRERFRGPNGEADFNGFVPMPESLAVGDVGALSGVASHGVPFDDLTAEQLDAIGYFLRRVGEEETRRQYDILRENKRLYGYTDWYGWCSEKWGTKWNAYYIADVTVSPDGRTLHYRFDTAWAPPVPVFAAASKAFPSLRLHVSWREEGGAHDTFDMKAGEYVY